MIISGLDLQARSYARATSGNDLVEETSSQSGGEFTGLRKKVAEFANKTMGVQLQTRDIIACHELPSRREERVKPVIVSLINNAVKRDVMMGRKKLKGTRTYVNEQLTKKNAALFKKARDLTKTGKDRQHVDVQREGLPKEVAIWVAQRDNSRRGS